MRSGLETSEYTFPDMAVSREISDVDDEEARFYSIFKATAQMG